MKSTISTVLDLGNQKVNLQGEVYYQLSVPALIEHAIKNGEGVLTDKGALAADTGRFTGRSPGDRYIVEDTETIDTVWWGDVNQPIGRHYFDQLLKKMLNYIKIRKLYIRDGYVCASKEHHLNLRVITESAYQNIFANNLFLRLSEENSIPTPAWTILAIPSFEANPMVDGVKNSNFVIINFTAKIILIGGTGYTGEIKKSIFSVLNYLLPIKKNVLSMHCSANVGKTAEDTALFFGLSGTGKTTLSADPQRKLVGDDEHGWDDNGIFNFEGGCYAKCVGLDPIKEPQIFHAIRFGTLLENVCMIGEARVPDYQNISKTENTRAAYPANFIAGALEPALAKEPKNIFFLTADAFGVLPPISKLTVAQAMYHFISGYTAKVAGTEAGINEPTATFSACFGKAFLPLHPGKYAEILGEKLINGNVKVWLVNTGWVGGAYGVGKRMELKYTRNLIKAALSGTLENVPYKQHLIFGLSYPTECAGVPANLLSPRDSWADKDAYFVKAQQLAEAFLENFRQYEAQVSEEIKSAAPVINVVDIDLSS
ncbi:phosphoenolpyruvate carboxykinase (ATP) [Olivibacter sp. SDN3]|uniref:phosphoenolpyruvate carboxykinase (ATP) n=1 Tax=Olivibacter sp. SDN3 TaxID=2764720 RepID=UPI00165183F8|nr:phosphoenolpyruvate carboxykinase (ATP) [Olivibacter sp. SDN3]QNL49083.1 phosphoenolpyruvate carboxykinase (ATP) [Olivibacter sp. SDN3]